MSVISSSAEIAAPASALEPFVTPEQLQAMQGQDELLLRQLAGHTYGTPRYPSHAPGMSFANKELAGLAREAYSHHELTQLEDFLTEQGTLDLPIVDGYTVTVDGLEHDLSLVAATEIGDDGASHGDMSSMIYLRDQIQAASALLQLSHRNPDRYGAEGKTGQQLLLSALHCMSTPAQLNRFEDVIARGPAAGQADWPHISLHFNDLDATGPNGWRNKQDSFQMLAFSTLEAVEQGAIRVEDLAPAHKKFLGAIVPFLQSVGFPLYESSGSWEENAARRTSVMAIETALLHKIKTMAGNPAFDFLAQAYHGRDGRDNQPGTFTEAVDQLLHHGLHELGRRLPHESPDYPQDSVKYREADAALAYVLRYDVSRLLADHNVPIGKDGAPLPATAIEDMVLQELYGLIDPATNGMVRYARDSYQRVNFHTNEVQLIVRGLKLRVQHDATARGTEIDLDHKQSLRDQLTPDGQPAAWTHPMGQISSWAARRSLEAQDQGQTALAEHYQDISSLFMNAAISTVTGQGQYHAVLDSQGSYRLRPVPAGKLPECDVTYRLPDGRTFAVPSPHTPLNWSTAMTKEAVGLLRISLQRATASRRAQLDQSS